MAVPDRAKFLVAAAAPVEWLRRMPAYFQRWARPTSNYAIEMEKLSDWHLEYQDIAAAGSILQAVQLSNIHSSMSLQFTSDAHSSR
jgi:hypothetical protein